MNQKLLTSLKSQIESKISNHVTNIKTYLNTKEDSNIIEKVIEFELEQISKFQNYINVLEKYFSNNTSSNFETEENTQFIINWDDEKEEDQIVNNISNWDENLSWGPSQKNNLTPKSSLNNLENHQTNTVPDWVNEINKKYSND